MSNFERHLLELRKISSEGYALKPDGAKDKGLYSYPVLLIEDALKKIIALEKEINTYENAPLPEREDNENNTLSEVKDVITELEEILIISPFNDQSYKKLVAQKDALEKLVTQKTSAIKDFQREIVKLLEDLQQLSKFERTLNVMVDKSRDQLETMRPDSAVSMGASLFSDEKSTDKAN